ncbi:MAG: T9SS type A sorting domain-containing protein [Bacteroidales bacterium]
MKRIATLFALTLFSVGVFGQAFSGIGWVNWLEEPDYADVTGYAANPYDNPVVEVIQAPAGLTPDLIADAASFDMAWSMLGDSMAVANPTNVTGGDLFDLGEAAPSFGAAWKAVHDGSALYIFLKYWDTNTQADAATRTFEIMAQPTSPVRHEPTFEAAADSAEAVRVAYENMAYARITELGGGKAMFADGSVGAYEGTVGLDKSFHEARQYWQASWGSNEHGLLALASATHFWDDTEGVIRAVMVMSFDGALGYPADPTDLAGDYVAVEPGDTIAFDVKSNAAVGDEKVEYFWAADMNNGYASNYYSGHLILKEAAQPPEGVAFSGIGWVNWLAEPDYADVTGYADNPYDHPEVTIKQAPEAWTPVADVAGFDATWGILGDSMAVANPTNVTGGDLFDLGEAAPSFGAAWKGVHDGSAFYVFLKYWDTNTQADDATRTFEVMAQPTSPVRHEPTFEAAADSAEAVRVAYENMAYARITELGGGKAMFADGSVGAYEGTVGLDKSFHEAREYWQASWGSNEHGLLALASATHFWDDTEGVIRAVMVMSFDGALGYPVDPEDLAGDYNAIQVGETFSFDVKSNAAVADEKVEYFWAADMNNGYASNYYSGHLTLSDEVIQISGIEDRTLRNIRVFMHHDFLNIRGVETTDVKVYSITGAVVKSAENVSRQMDMSDVSDGVYIVKLKGISSGFKVVK